jgi:hypothetical protein
MTQRGFVNGNISCRPLVLKFVIWTMIIHKYLLGARNLLFNFFLNVYGLYYFIVRVFLPLPDFFYLVLCSSLKYILFPFLPYFLASMVTLGLIQRKFGLQQKVSCNYENNSGKWSIDWGTFHYKKFFSNSRILVAWSLKSLYYHSLAPWVSEQTWLGMYCSFWMKKKKKRLEKLPQTLHHPSQTFWYLVDTFSILAYK